MDAAFVGDLLELELQTIAQAFEVTFFLQAEPDFGGAESFLCLEEGLEEGEEGGTFLLEGLAFGKDAGEEGGGAEGGGVVGICVRLQLEMKRGEL